MRERENERERERAIEVEQCSRLPLREEWWREGEDRENRCDFNESSSP